ncbi:irc3 [Symbiodinium sp. CCMP2456]|nr:irc3 [Symbiodinium sp. CCMP2456]
MWAAVLELDVVPTQDLPPWFLQRRNLTRRSLGVDLLSLDGFRAVLCSVGMNGTLRHVEVKRFLRTARHVCKAVSYIVVTTKGCKLGANSKRWLGQYSAQAKAFSKSWLRRLLKTASSKDPAAESPCQLIVPPLRRCQMDCLEACAQGARNVELACGTGKTRIIHELAMKASGRVLVTVPSRILLEQFAEDFPTFCKVGTGYNRNIDYDSQGFVAVTDSAHLLRNIKFSSIFMDEAHHATPQGMPQGRELYKFSATHEAEADFEYTLGQAIEDGVLCDYDLTVPVTTEGHPYLCLAEFLLSQAGRFRRVLAYCNSVREAVRFQQVLQSLGLSAWHMNGQTPLRTRESFMAEFTGPLQKPIHVLVTVQVLGEGVNIPSADTCMFVEPRRSYVSIIQAIGRVLRHSPAKPLAHVVLPAVAIVSTVAMNHSQVPPKEIQNRCGDTRNASLQSNVVRKAGAASEFKHHEQHQQSDGLDWFDSRLAASASRMSVTRSSTRFAEPGSINHSFGELDPWARTGATACASGRKAGSCTGDERAHQAKLHSLDSKVQVRHETPSPSEEMPRAQSDHFGGSTSGAADFQAGATKSQSVEHQHVPSALSVNTGGAPRSGRVKTRVGPVMCALSDECHSTQLERFMSVIGQADSRLLQQGLTSRLWIADARTARGSMSRIAKDVFSQVMLALQQKDPWELNLQATEAFVAKHGKLPAERGPRLQEALLGVWLRNVGVRLRKQSLHAYRVQRLQNSTCELLQARVQEWLGQDVIFRQRCTKLQDFVRRHGKLPSMAGFPRSTNCMEYRLAYFLASMKKGATHLTPSRLKFLKELHPMISSKIESWQGNINCVTLSTWQMRCRHLARFVLQAGRLPSSKRPGETSLYWWMLSQRYRFLLLPLELQKQLSSSSPIVAAFVASQSTRGWANSDVTLLSSGE